MAHIDKIDNEVQEVLDAITRLRTELRLPKTPQELEALEREIVQTTDKLAGLLTAKQIQGAVDSEELRGEASELVKGHPKQLKSNGCEEVKIKLLRGGTATIKVPYYCRKRFGPRKFGTKKDKGLYPSLILLGICERFTPALASEATMLSVAMGSLEEACNILKEQGIKINIKTLRSLTCRYAQRARATLRSETFEFEDCVAGCRVVISTDGGRVRIRRKKRGPKTQKGRNRYYTGWKEPKLLNIYIADENGRKSQEFQPFIDGTMKGPDTIFMLINYYLSKLGITQAAALLFVADGAHWIWNRIEKLVKDLHIDVKKVYELLDFYHAVEHLGTVASLRKSWSAEEKRRWIKKHRSLLKKGRVTEVVDAVKAICRGRNSDEIRRERDYFVRNRERMNYPLMEQMKLPLGSGSMESSVRRVINLRMKGPGIFWLEESAEAMLLLRSFYKAGRWSMLKLLVFSEESRTVV